jgi:hypothetical protein
VQKQRRTVSNASANATSCSDCVNGAPVVERRCDFGNTVVVVKFEQVQRQPNELANDERLLLDAGLREDARRHPVAHLVSQIAAQGGTFTTL